MGDAVLYIPTVSLSPIEGGKWNAHPPKFKRRRNKVKRGKMRGKISINMAYFPKFSAFFKKRGGGVITGFPPSPLANPILNKPLLKKNVHTAQNITNITNIEQSVAL